MGLAPNCAFFATLLEKIKNDFYNESFLFLDFCMTKLLFGLGAAAVFWLSACSALPQNDDAPLIGVASPASVYCAEQGGVSQSERDERGNEYGVCLLANGERVDEWELYRGEASSDRLLVFYDAQKRDAALAAIAAQGGAVVYDYRNFSGFAITVPDVQSAKRALEAAEGVLSVQFDQKNSLH